MKSREHNQFFSLFQLIAGVLATLLVIFSYVKFHKPLQSFFEQLSGGKTLVSLQEVLDGAKNITEHVEKTISTHGESVNSISESTRVATEIVEQWKGGTDTFTTVLQETALVTENFAQHLPLHLPSVQTTNQLFTFDIPQVTSATRDVNIPYPVIEPVHEQTKEIEYPSAVVVQMKNFQKDLGYLKIKKRNRTKGPDSPVQQNTLVQQGPVQGGGCIDCMKLGVITFDYPADIEVQHETLSITYPEQLTIGSANKKISVPDLKVSMQEHQVEIPQVSVEEKPILEEEKVVLLKISEKLRAIASSLGTTRTSFDELLRLLKEARLSLQATESHLDHAEQAAEQLHQQLITLVGELELQKQEMVQLRKKFAAIAGLLPLLFAVLGLLCAATAASGAAKLCVHHHDRKGCPPKKTPEGKGSCSPEQEPQPGTPQEQEPQPDTPQQQYDGPQQEQSDVVQEPVEQDPSQHTPEQRREI